MCTVFVLFIAHYVDTYTLLCERSRIRALACTRMKIPGKFMHKIFYPFNNPLQSAGHNGLRVYNTVRCPPLLNKIFFGP